MKTHLIRITDKENNKLKEIKKELRLNNVNLTFKKLINDFKLEGE